VYAWAGEFRTVNLARGNSFFARPEYIVPELQKVLDWLASEHLLRGADSQGFGKRAAYFFGEMNAVHPFREGNGRAPREFPRELAVGAGYELAWDLVPLEEMHAASIASFQGGGSAGFATLLNKIIGPLGQACAASLSGTDRVFDYAFSPFSCAARSEVAGSVVHRALRKRECARLADFFGGEGRASLAARCRAAGVFSVLLTVYPLE